jgi:CRP-like cAMP-binding protein
VQVEILAEGDHVNELMVVVSGLVEVLKPSIGAKRSEDLVIAEDGNSSVHIGNRCLLQHHGCAAYGDWPAERSASGAVFSLFILARPPACAGPFHGIMQGDHSQIYTHECFPS